jgi:cob(I)alamin adenosyltransferase
MKVYTKTGDRGTTSLIGGERVSKADPRVEAYGTVDELAAHLALLGDMMRVDNEARFAATVAAIDNIQRDLMTVEAILATGGGNAHSGLSGGSRKVVVLEPADTVGRLEREIDVMSASLPPVEGFTLPGGHPIVSQSHICRTVCRRAERAVVRIGDDENSQQAQKYLNRLSDWLYVVGREAVKKMSIKETYWKP